MSKTLKNIFRFVIDTIIIATTIASVLSFFYDGGEGNMTSTGTVCFRYYTIDSNILLALSSLVSIIWNLVTIKKPEKQKPVLISLLRLSGVASAFLTFITVVTFLGPQMGYLKMFEGWCLVLHLTNPILAVVTYLLFDEAQYLKGVVSLMAAVPTYIYGVVYATMVINIGVENQGWEDFYHFNINGKWYLTFIAIIVVILIITIVLWKLERVFKKTDVKLLRQDMFIPLGVHESELTYTDTFLKTIMKFSLFTITGAFLLVGIVLLVEKLFGFYYEVKLNTIIVLLIVSASCVLLSLFISLLSTNNKGALRKKAMVVAKIYLTLVILGLWNVYMYLIPLSYIWEFTILSLLVASLLFDYRLIDFVGIGLIVSNSIFWLVNWDSMGNNVEESLPLFIMQIVITVLSMIVIHLFVYYADKKLLERSITIDSFDMLTGLIQKKYINEHLKKIYKDAKKYKHEFCIAMIDIDNLHKISEQFGHEAGDSIIKGISGIIHKSVQDNGITFQWGVDEILVIFTCDRIVAYGLLEDIKDKTNGRTFTFDNEQVTHMSVTAGLSFYANNKTPREMFEKANELLKQGKETGKNKVVLEMR